MSPFNRFDIIYYINLDKREDRKTQLLQELNKMNIDMNKVKRIPGVISHLSCLGCSLAHLNALLDFQQNNYNNCLILEDDFTFKHDQKTTFDVLNNFWNSGKQWDVLMMSGNIRKYAPTDHKNIYKVTDAQLASGYSVNKNFLPILLNNYQDGINQLSKLEKRRSELCLDIYWKVLQPKSNWFVLYPKIGCQRPGFSDIENRDVNYNRFEINDIKVKS